MSALPIQREPITWTDDAGTEYDGLAVFEKPKVVLPGGSVTISQTARDLFGIIAPAHKIFARGKAVVSLMRSHDGDYVLEPLRPSTARSSLENYAAFEAWRVVKGEKDPQLKPTIMPEDMCRALLDSEIASETLAQIKGLTNCPIIFADGDVLKVAGCGYSTETQMLIQKGETPLDVPLLEAVKSIKGLLAEFAFQTPGDHSRAMAAFITPALKMGGLLRGLVPVDVAEADKSQSGKTYRQKLLCALYGERPAIVALKHGGVGSTDESLQEKLVNGRPFIQFDNFRGKLDSKVLESFLTAEGSFPARVPHCREVEVDPSRFFVLMTSNGVETSIDLANRSSIVRIYKRPGVLFADSLGDVKDRQAYYLGCVFAIVREWHRQGCKRTDDTRHDFREWAQTLDWIVQNICEMAPLMDGHVAAQGRVSNPMLTFLRLIAIAVEGSSRLDEPLSTQDIIDVADGYSFDVPGLKGWEDDEKKRKILGQRLAPFFKLEDTLEIDGHTVRREIVSKIRTDGQGHYESKEYVFGKLK